MSSSLAAILIAAVPLTIALLALRFDPSERVDGTRLAGLVVGLAGVVALVGLDVAGSASELLGTACVLVAVVGYAAGPMILRAHLGDVDPRGLVAASLAVAAVAAGAARAGRRAARAAVRRARSPRSRCSASPARRWPSCSSPR